MRVLVLGGAGFLGTVLVEELAKVKSNRLQVVDSFTHGFPKNQKPRKNVEPWISASVSDFRNLLRIMERFQPDVVFHLAAYTSRPETLDREFRTCAEVNYGGTANVIHAVMSLKQRPKKLIFASTLAAQDPQMHFGIAKRAAEDLLLSTLGRVPEYGVQPHILRFGEIYGPSYIQSSTSMANFLVDNMLLGHDLHLFSVQEKLDCLHISDAVEACKLVATSDTTEPLIEIGTGEGVVILDLVNKVRDLVGYKGQLRFSEDGKIPIQTYLADTLLAERVLGFKATSDLDVGLAELVKKRRKVLG